MSPYKRRSDDEHRQILEALRTGEIERAVQILEPHLLQTGEMLASYLAPQLVAKLPASGRARGKRKSASAAGG
jgi:DNA-binding GntR family transcriptional regulator